MPSRAQIREGVFSRINGGFTTFFLSREQPDSLRVTVPMSLRPAALKRPLIRVFTALAAFLLSFALGLGMSPIGFRLDGMGHGKVLDGDGFFGIQSYTSTYFIKLWFYQARYRSPEKANEVFTNFVTSAIRVVDRQPKYNRQGVKVGERAVAVLLNPETNEQFASVFWTDGPTLFSIDSSSMIHVLQFEQYRNDEKR